MRRIRFAIALVCSAILLASCAPSNKRTLAQEYPSVEGTQSLTHENEGVSITLAAPPDPYQNDESYTAALTLSNEGSATVRVMRSGGRVFNLIATDITGPKVYDARKTRGVASSDAADIHELPPGESIVETLPFWLPEPGKYRLHARMLNENDRWLAKYPVYLDVTAE